MLNLERHNHPCPRYTSYPTAPTWGHFSSESYCEKLDSLNDEPLSLYIHIPFCASMCLFCGCSVILNRKEDKEIEYVDYLIREMELVSSRLKRRQKVSQLHFGGGTPTKLSNSLFEKLFRNIQSFFELEGEIAIEIDPRTACGKLSFLKELGFNRVSFGVQDTDRAVQEAVKRRQSEKMTRDTFWEAQEVGFEEINIDLIYGLPKQTQASFENTVSTILELRPTRIALFSYAKVPWLKEHQKAIKESDLPNLEEKFAIYMQARSRFIAAGYIAIGMDHFALCGSELAKSYEKRTLARNFQGYTVKSSETLLGFGVTSIGYTKDTYTQNVKDLDTYYAALAQGMLPAFRGKHLTPDDKKRKWVIQSLMCRFEVDKTLFEETFATPFDTYFAQVDLTSVEDLVRDDGKILRVTPTGELLVRNVAMHFDAYLTQQPQKFSQSI